jgi:hypothetical protein
MFDVVAVTILPRVPTLSIRNRPLWRCFVEDLY